MLTATAFSQEKKDIYHSNSYLLELPDPWKKPKPLKAITYILPETIEQLNGKEVTLDGAADYTVKLVIDSITVKDEVRSSPLAYTAYGNTQYKYTYSFKYSYEAGFRIFDTTGRPLAFLKLISREEVFEFSKEFTILPANHFEQWENVYDSSNRVISKRLVQTASPLKSDIPEYKPTLFLDYDVILSEIEKRIYETRKILQNLN